MMIMIAAAAGAVVVVIAVAMLVALKECDHPYREMRHQSLRQI